MWTPSISVNSMYLLQHLVILPDTCSKPAPQSKKKKRILLRNDFISRTEYSVRHLLDTLTTKQKKTKTGYYCTMTLYLELNIQQDTWSKSSSQSKKYQNWIFLHYDFVSASSMDGVLLHTVKTHPLVFCKIQGSVVLETSSRFLASDWLRGPREQFQEERPFSHFILQNVHSIR